MNRFDWHDPTTHPPLGQLVIVHIAGLTLGDSWSFEWHIAKLDAASPVVAAIYADDGWAPWVWLTQDDDYHDIISDQRLGPMAWDPLPDTGTSDA